MQATSTTIRDRAAEVARAARLRSLEIEQAGAVPDDVVGQLEASGLLRLFVPRSLGGLEVDPITAFEAIELRRPLTARALPAGAQGGGLVER